MKQNGTILIVEDNVMSLEMAKSLLHLAGYNTLEACNADNGISLAKNHRPDLILMDMHLPMKSGYEATQELKQHPETGHIPVVAFTALAMREEQERAIAEGCAGVICKPIDVKEFARTVETFLQSGPSAKSIEPSVDTGAYTILPVTSECPQCADKQKLEQDFEEFLFHVSHDLQGPLRKIQQFSRFMENGEVNLKKGEKEVYYQGISRNAQELENLLQGLLKLSRINKNREAFQDFSLNNAVEKALQQVETLDATVVVGKLPCITGDFEQMTCVFEALIANALKFKSETQPTSIKIQSAERDDHFCEITVEDNGIGFPQPMAERIFKPLLRLNGDSKYPGSGVGLAIVKKIVERHGGKISASCKPGVGTVFSIQMPVSQ